MFSEETKAKMSAAKIRAAKGTTICVYGPQGSLVYTFSSAGNAAN